ncbi:MAG: NPCBM/NEW2 domain-containing protein [Planctomycetes bacterium]|nr:NPCBM/NEW2 domain-containing protein [Planctomycetota bacterium]
MRGTLLKIAPEITLSTADGQRAFGWADVLDVRPIPFATEAAEPDVAAAAGWQLTLADGSHFQSKIGGSADDGLTATLPDGASLKVKMSDLRWAASAASLPIIQSRIGELLAEADPVDDAVVLVRDSDPVVLRGALRRMDDRGVMFAWKERDLPISWEKLAGLFVARPTPRDPPITVRLRGGDALAGKITAGDEQGVTLQGAAEFSLPWTRIERIEVRSNRVAYLSHLTPQAYEFRAFFSKRWEPSLDRTFSRRPIRLGGREYPRGVVMHSQSRLVYSLNGAARQFAAVFGILDEMGQRGDVTAKVIGDGRVLWHAENVAGGQPPREVLVDVGGVLVLELIVEFGDGLDLSDQAAWAQARVIR